ncbi:MAG: DUF5674 family protein [Eubacteriales bacterium]|nr:DUF5674 family protein [Eubacteriales bacterium]
MKILKEQIHIKDLAHFENNYFKDMIKCVADVKQNIIALDASMHSDLERFLLEEGCENKNLWGFNLYFDGDNIEDIIEYNSLINIRPYQNNNSMEIKDEKIKNDILKVVKNWII